MSTLYKFERIDAWLTPLMLSVMILGGMKFFYSFAIGPLLENRYPALASRFMQHDAIITAAGFILLYAVFLLFFLHQQKTLQGEEEDILHQIQDTLDAFTPSQTHGSEEGYRGELYRYLINYFPDVDMTVQNDRGRPSITLKGIGIEIRGPVDNGTLDSIATLCMKSSADLRSLVVILCEPRYTPDHFHDVEKGIKQYFRNVRILQK